MPVFSSALVGASVRTLDLREHPGERPTQGGSVFSRVSWRYSLRFSLAPLSDAWLADHAATSGRRAGDI